VQEISREQGLFIAHSSPKGERFRKEISWVESQNGQNILMSLMRRVSGFLKFY
jgi:hypothetical protein